MRQAWILAVSLAVLPRSGVAQALSDLISPGELSSAHAKYSGVKNCNVCHGGDRDVLESRCEDCHKELAARIVAGKGFHADKGGRCVSCHSEHLGKDSDIRALDRSTFNHDQTGYKLAGKHSAIKDCARCHKTRSFLGNRTTCQSCHNDRHQGRLPNCEQCHSFDRSFKEPSFDHSTARYVLTGAHTRVACSACHKNEVFRGLAFDQCGACHTDPHRKMLGTDCSRCHRTELWKGVQVPHKTFPLAGKHAAVDCAKCHPEGRWKLAAFGKCADCHKDKHLGQFKQPCEDCHSVNGFKPAKFNHDRFKLELKHAIDCQKCHKSEKGAFPAGTGTTVRYKPMNAACASCHKDPHAQQLGAKCENCHTIASFKLTGFDHSKARYPLDEKHAKVACEKCHKKDAKTGGVIYKPLAMNCGACHSDVHLAQLGQNCERCHAPARLLFTHTMTTYPLEGKHASVSCEKCHKKEKGTFPAGAGEAVRYKPIARACATCHADYHRGQFPRDCAACHTTASFKPTSFAHAKSEYPLKGKHTNLQCDRCHKQEVFPAPPPPATLVRYRPMAKVCSACHRDQHAGVFGSDCAKCHDERTWHGINATFHRSTAFPLTGRHVTVPCVSCHISPGATPTACESCHMKRRQDDPFRGRLGLACAQCHNTGGWSPVQFDHGARTGFALVSEHSGLRCQACHPGQIEAVTSTCAGCHMKDYDWARTPPHKAIGLSTDCRVCHFPGDGAWSAGRYTHRSYQPLGRHSAAACDACHSGGRYAGLSQECYACHKPDYDRTQNPNHIKVGFSTDCVLCHRAGDSSWTQGRFDHSGFPLQGGHVGLACESCHEGGKYSGLSTDCYSCHRADYDSTTNPNHKTAGFPTDCIVCHKATDTRWEQGRFDHNSSDFPLQGAHAKLACESCHKGGKYSGLSPDCYSCHKADYDGTTDPNHRTAGFPTSCVVCHKATDTNWNQGKFDHANTGFALQGAHTKLACESCHKGGIYTGLSPDCYSCHKADYDGTTNPNHKTAGFPTSCIVCHKATDTNWNQGKFDHSNTGFTLQGAHTKLACASCHKGGVYTGLSADCYSCHKADYDGTKNPNHKNAGFPTSCLLCHKATDLNWRQAKFDHGTTGFPLQGAHTKLVCESCHKGGKYTGLSPDCYSCHKADYDGTANPNHKNAGFPTSCVVCHKATDTNWHQAKFDHATTGFALQGAHTKLVCESCHKGGKYTGLSPDCYSCHKADYDGTANPNHKNAGFPTSCIVCHKATDTNWHQAKFDHATTGFALQGAHAKLACASCHKGGVYAGLSSDCYSCHKADYDGTKNPNHKSAGFPTSCIVCHKATDTSWHQAKFDHANTGFPLQGAHTSLTCESCHKGGIYAGLSTDCYSCHKADYDTSTNPNHKNAGFPTDCSTCHYATDTSWNQGRFDHRFPISSGRHKFACSSCHTDPSNYRVFDCLSCHPLSSIQDKHREVGGFQYTSQACYACHPNGTADD
ncbi:MAG: hypothetical protein AB1714_17105 [Acidobacteriota bacterium]